MADFSLYYPHLLKFEGGYASAAYAAKMGDSGGETYCGIARNYNLDWPGWKIIDAYKLSKGEPKYNSKINDKQLYDLCLQHSKVAYWDKMKLDKVLNQSVAEMIGDYGFNSGIGTSVKAAQRIVHGKVESITGVMSDEDIKLINLEKPKKVFETLRDMRIGMIQRSTKINPLFKDGLINRANSIKFNE